MVLIQNLWQDIRFGARNLRNNPAFSFAAVLTLALGIAGNTTIFSITSALLLRPLPYSDPSRLVVIEMNRRESGHTSTPPCTLARYEEIRDHSNSFAGVVAVTGDSANVTGNGDPEQIPIARVSPNFLDVLGIRPQLGRTFTEDEGQPAGKPVVMISDSLWHSRFGADPNIVGKTLNLDSVPETIVGVVPNVPFPFMGPAELWSPRYFDLSVLTPQHIRSGAGYLTILARLRPGASVSSAKAEMDVLNSRYTLENPKAPDTGKDVSISVADLQEQTVSDIRSRLLVLSAAVGVLLLIACANVASLLLSRALRRRKEIAIRTALGAKRRVVIQQLLTENVLLGIFSGVTGIILAWLALIGLRSLGVTDWLPSVPITLDWRVLFFTLVLSIAAGIGFGLVPALQLSTGDLNSVLRDEGRGASGGRRRAQVQNLLVVSQVALSMLLLVAAGLLGRSFAHLLRVSPGFDPNNVLTMNISLPTVKYADAQKQIAFFSELRRRVSALPGVRSAGLSAARPLSKIRVTPILFDGQPQLPLMERPFTTIEAITPGYLETMRIPLLSGRSFTDADDKQAPLVVMVNQALARRYWPNENPIGKHMSVGRQQPAEVVGVAGNAKNNGLAEQADPEVYLPFAQLPWGNMNLFVRTTVNPHSLVAAVRKQVSAIDADQPVTRVETVSELMDASRAQPRFTMFLLITFSGTALVLAVVGIYGVLNYVVTQRRQELGVRMALGAEKADIQRLIIGNGLLLTSVGVALGWIAGLSFTSIMQSMLYQVGSRDFTTFSVAAVAFLVIAFLASYLPARRATKVDPVEALRYE
jgi:predicted permease